MLALFLILLAFGLGIGLRGFSGPASTSAASAQFWPLFCTVGIFISGILLAARSILRMTGLIDDFAKANQYSLFSLRQFLSAVSIIFLLAVYAVLIVEAGVVLASMLFLIGCWWGSSSRERWYALLFGVIVPVFLYGFFLYVVKVPISAGVLSGVFGV